MDISELVGEWPRIMSLEKEGALTKKDVLEALRSGEPVPPKVALFLADILDGTYRFKSGKKPKGIFTKRVAWILFEHLKKELEAGDLSGICEPEERRCIEGDLAAGETPYSIALRVTAKTYDISTRQLEAYISDCRRIGGGMLR